MSPDDAVKHILATTPAACRQLNAFSKKVFRTRGGRVGSGMGSLLEALWGYYVNSELRRSTQCEIVWLPGHEYNDFACIAIDCDWSGESRGGEFLRIEAKSMNADADESKGHFDQPIKNLHVHDLLLVLIWKWQLVDRMRAFPQIIGHFIGRARDIAELRDALHIARGGTFVDRNNCPDKCLPEGCLHDGEPLNSAGKRERRQGPDSRKPANVSYAANFGGLRRMLYTRSPQARLVLQEHRRENDLAHDYISLIHRHFPKDEESLYSADDWRRVAETLGLETSGKSKAELVNSVRAVPKYMEALRSL